MSGSLIGRHTLGLNERIGLVETTHGDPAFKDEAIDLLKKEKLLHAELVHRVTRLRAAEKKKPWKKTVNF